ncbi:hypothetical protein ACH4NO_10465 [Streptomyces olivaceus]|uniref:hypothetical protein n=1 Tax=Streptomyces olivaceus TaxID=47716 RepID=UPI0037930A41
MSDGIAGSTDSAGADVAQADTAAVTTVSSHFKMVFIAVVVITVGALAANLYIAIFVPKPTEAAKSAMDTCATIANLGFGAIVGLLGGKAV